MGELEPEASMVSSMRPFLDVSYIPVQQDMIHRRLHYIHRPHSIPTHCRHFSERLWGRKIVILCTNDHKLDFLWLGRSCFLPLYEASCILLLLLLLVFYSLGYSIGFLIDSRFNTQQCILWAEAKRELHTSNGSVCFTDRDPDVLTVTQSPCAELGQ